MTDIRAWQDIVTSAQILLDQIGASLEGIKNYKADLVTQDDDVWLIANGVTIVIEKKYWNAFEEVERDFVSRGSLLKEITLPNADTPSPDRVRVWRERLDKLQDDLKAALDDLLRLVAMPNRNVQKWWKF